MMEVLTVVYRLPLAVQNTQLRHRNRVTCPWLLQSAVERHRSSLSE